jgi:hypothetical protein
VVISLLACNSNAASLQPSETRQKWEDLGVITLDSQGNPAKTVYYSHAQLLTLPTVTVKTERDPNTNTPAMYTGVYIDDLFKAFGADASLDVIGTNSLDRYKQYYDRDYIAKHRPILLLKFDGILLDDWGRPERTEQRLVPTASFTNPLFPWKRSTATSKNREARTRSCRLSLPVTTSRWGVSRQRRVGMIRKSLKARKLQ